MKKSLTVLALALAAGGAHAAQPDYSGVYDCTGDDHHEGKYAGTVTLQLVEKQSIKSHSAYSFKLEVPGYGVYLGQAAASGSQMAIHFALADQSTKDYGTGLATFVINRGGKWTFNKYYYEPEFKGGNYGLEQCVHR